MFSFSCPLVSRIRRRTAAAMAAVVVAGIAPLAVSGATPALAGDASTSPAGYWLVASDGGIFSFGDARFFGSTGAIRLNQPITGMATTPTGNGYWLVASDGGIFSFGDARFFGSTGAIHLNQPITGMATTSTGNGYWLTASDGGVFGFGDAGFYGAAPSRPARGPRRIVAMVPTDSGAGYWQASSSGELLPFGNASDLGGVSSLNRPIVAMAALPHRGSRPGFVAPSAGDTTTPTNGTTTPTSTPTQSVAPSGQTFSNTARSSWGTTLATSPNPSAVYGGAEKVLVVVEDSDKMFVAGEFRNLVDPSSPPDANGSPTVVANPALPYVAQLDVATGAPTPGSAFNATIQPDGAVHAMALSPQGNRLYLAGDFLHIGGQPAEKLAAVDVATGKLDPTFVPPIPNGHTRALLLHGNTLYVGGAFTKMGSTDRPLVAALDAKTGALIDGFASQLQDYGGHYASHSGTPTESPAPPGQPTFDPGVVHDFGLTGDGKTLLAGGDFLHLGTSLTADPKHQHGGLVALDPTTGQLAPWQPVNTRPTFGLAASPTDGQTFFTAEGGAGGMGMEFKVGDPKTTATPRWSSLVDGDALGVVATPARVYVVGHFQHLCSAPLVPNANGGLSCPPGKTKGAFHNHMAAYYPDTGTTDETFTAAVNTPKGPDDVFLGAHDLYVGGDFTQVAPQYNHAAGNFRPQPGLAIFPANG